MWELKYNFVKGLRTWYLGGDMAGYTNWVTRDRRMGEMVKHMTETTSLKSHSLELSIQREIVASLQFLP